MPEHLTALLHEAIAACEDATPSVMLSSGPVCLRIRCTDVSVLASLEAMLAPALMPAASATGKDVQDVRVVLDPNLSQRLEHAIADAGHLDAVGEPHLVSDGIHLVRKEAGVLSEHRSAYLLWAEDDPWTNYIVLDGSGASSDRLLLRLVRGVAARVLLAAGWIPLRSACVLTKAGAVCLLGEQGSGKTTALLHLLAGAAGPVALVANSIVFLSPHGTVEVRTLPTTIGVRVPTLKLFPGLDSLVGETGGATDRQRKVYLPAPRIAESFGVFLSAGGPLTAFVEVAYHGAPQSTWRPLATQERETVMRKAHLPDGLVDDPHEHARLASTHTRWHYRRLRQCAESTQAAALEPGMDTAQVLGAGLGELLAQAAR